MCYNTHIKYFGFIWVLYCEMLNQHCSLRMPFIAFDYLNPEQYLYISIIPWLYLIRHKRIIYNQPFVYLFKSDQEEYLKQIFNNL